jgi:hypothetical protein
MAEAEYPKPAAGEKRESMGAALGWLRLKTSFPVERTATTGAKPIPAGKRLVRLTIDGTREYIVGF